MPFTNDRQTMKPAFDDIKSDFPFGQVFLEIFGNYIDLETLEYMNIGIIAPSTVNRYFFRANIDDPALRLSMELKVSSSTDDLLLEIYKGLIDDREYHVNSWFRYLVYNVSGIWAYGQGNLCTKAIRFCPPVSDIYLPSAEERWFSGFIDSFSRTVATFVKKDVKNLPKFWDGQGNTVDD